MDVTAVDHQVAQEPAVGVTVGLTGVGHQCRDRPHRGVLRQSRPGLLGFALLGLSVVGEFGGIDTQEPDPPEVDAVTIDDTDRVSVCDPRDGYLHDGASVVRGRPCRGTDRPPDPAGGNRRRNEAATDGASHG